MPKWLVTALLLMGALVMLPALLAAVAERVFNQRAAREVSGLLDKNRNNQQGITEKKDLQGLPLPVQKWLERSRVLGKDKIDTVYLRQKGLMRIKEDGPWMKAEGDDLVSHGGPE